MPGPAETGAGFRAAPCPPIPPTPRQRDLLRVLAELYDEFGLIPSYEDLCREMDVASKGTIHRLMVGLADRGWVRLPCGRHGAVTILHRPVMPAFDHVFSLTRDPAFAINPAELDALEVRHGQG